VALTANASAEDRAACLAVGMEDFLTKPVGRAQLMQLLERFPAASANEARSENALT
jgi:CheY-like chemotaxis protein